MKYFILTWDRWIVLHQTIDQIQIHSSVIIPSHHQRWEEKSQH